MIMYLKSSNQTSFYINPFSIQVGMNKKNSIHYNLSTFDCLQTLQYAYILALIHGIREYLDGVLNFGLAYSFVFVDE